MPEQLQTEESPDEIKFLLSKEEAEHCLFVANVQNKKGKWTTEGKEGLYRNGVLPGSQTPFLGCLGEFCVGCFLGLEADEEYRAAGDVADFVCASNSKHEKIHIDVKTQKKIYTNRSNIPKGQAPIIDQLDFFHFTRFNNNLKDFYIFSTFWSYFPDCFRRLKEGNFKKCPVVIHGYISKEKLLENMSQRRFDSLTAPGTENFAVSREELSPLAELKEIINLKYPIQLLSQADV